MALSSVGEGCHKQMEAVLPQIMDGVLIFLQDSVSTLIYCVVDTKILLSVLYNLLTLSR
jgi:hypothetical protein